jgi:predicted O-methyltransferase YrrM
MISENNLYKFIEDRVCGLDPYLNKVERDTHLSVLQSHMISGPLQAAFLKMIVTLCGAKNILEIGTFTGYASLAMAEGSPAGAEITTIECEPEIAEIARKNFSISPYKDKISLIEGDAKDILPEILKKKFDLVFIDADKISNKIYYDSLMNTQDSGIVILVDNVLWKGKVLDDHVNDNKTKSIKDFIDYVSKDVRCESFILPIRDGIYFIRKK